ncbi:diacylglycerol/lipid kinase family protein [Candidatus Enterococcus ikei]|uniref:Diacylglycerol kinase family lipid kinase n=1 Tax=Candidatus Enterococcus ikei TaxID=2815326 RepID=A0ABS3H0G1_9ENTE|nr:diacylglycerol kinase family protein [Enterococcus sp. DIV0869a]MBO0440184.1 diacylglycerol kinase family lipid kinase [Enterococcus sp. DIV0869a]
MENVMILFNETSGKDKGKELAEQFVEYAKDHGQTTTHFLLEQVGPDYDSKKTVEKAKTENIDTLIFIGGDGTINHNVEDFKEELPHLKVGLLPGGTVNNMARVLEIPMKFEAAADIILGGATRKIDYGMINEKVIVSTMTIGILADTAARISQEDKQKYGKLIFVKNFFKLLAKKKRYRLEIKTEKEQWQGKTQLVTVTMTNSVGGYTNFDDSASPDDGLFHLTILPKLNFFKLAFYLPKIIAGKIYELPDIKYITAAEIDIKSLNEKKVGTRVDGDPSEDLPIQMNVVKHGLTVFVPKS